MNGDLWPPALLCAAFGLALGFAPRKAWPASLAALAATATATACAPLASRWHGAILVACWAGIAACVGALHLPHGPGARGAMALSLGAGAGAGGALALSPSACPDLPLALAGAFLAWPAAWCVDRRAAIVPRVVASWLIAVALLAATLHALPVTTGDLPDHLE